MHQAIQKITETLAEGNHFVNCCSFGMVHVEAFKALLKLSSPFETLLHWTSGVQRLIRARTVQMVLILSLNLYIITFIVRVWPELGIILTLSQPVLIYDVVSLSVCIMPASLLSRWP